VRVAFSSAHPGHLYCTNPRDRAQILLFDYSTVAVVKTLLAPLAGGEAVTALALHPREELLAVGTAAGSLLLLRLETEAWAEVSAHGEGEAVAGLAFSACGSKLYSAAGTATFVWSVEEMQ
jgi:WD40 repeat protein